MTLGVALTVAYDGGAFLGWQKTEEGPSIEEALERALFHIFHFKPVLQAASRTDRGVHASGQIVQFILEKEIEPKKLLLGLNALLPYEIRILEARICPITFHPTLDALGKEYIYRLALGTAPHPLFREMAWHVPKFCLSEEVLLAIPDLVGERDFKAFCNQRKGLNYPTTVRNLKSITWKKEGTLLTFSLIGDHFLYKMARNIVGLLVQIGEGKFARELIPLLFQNRVRKEGAMTAPAHGLSLERVFY